MISCWFLIVLKFQVFLYQLWVLVIASQWRLPWLCYVHSPASPHSVHLFSPVLCLPDPHRHKDGGWSRCLCICVFCLYVRIWMQIHFGLSSLVWKILSDVLACPYISEVWVSFMPVKLDYLMSIKCRIFRRDLFIFSGVSLCFWVFFSPWSSSQAFPACLPFSVIGAGLAWSAGGQHGCTLPGKV